MEESGWKNVHGDVFRPPQYPMILSSLLGSGIQLFCMILIVICEFVFLVVVSSVGMIQSKFEGFFFIQILEVLLQNYEV